MLEKDNERRPPPPPPPPPPPFTTCFAGKRTNRQHDIASSMPVGALGEAVQSSSSSWIQWSRKRTKISMVLLLVLLLLLLVSSSFAGSLFPFRIRERSTRILSRVDFDSKKRGSVVGDRVHFLTKRPEVNCTNSVRNLLDYPPIRSPQEVHSVIAQIIEGKSVLELGTRNGDGMSCFSKFASSASAIEYDKEYCFKLEERAKLNDPPAWTVKCEDAFASSDLDADYITWWQQHPLTNRAVLTKLKKEQCIGRIRRTATALLVFDEKWGNDMRDFEYYRGAFARQERVKFDEREACTNDPLRKRKGLKDCERSHGYFSVGVLPISDFPDFRC